MNHILNFLTELYNNGLGYNSVNTAKSAISSILSLGCKKKLGDHPLVKRFMKGIFCSRPIFSRYNRTWNVDIVLDYILTLSPVNSLLLHMLTLKLIMLISLLTAQRLQTLELIDIKDCVWSDNELRIKIGSLIKTSKPGSHLKNIVLPAYKHDQRLCVVQTFIVYIQKLGN